MLYLNSLENSAISGQENRFVICHQPVDSMQTIPELAPSQQLLGRWQTKSIEWAEFREQYLQEMREEFLGEKSRLQGVAKSAEFGNRSNRGVVSSTWHYHPPPNIRLKIRK